MTTGQLIRIQRQKQGVSQGKIASQVGFTNPQFISNIERDVCGCPVELAVKLSKLLKISKQRFKDAMVADFIEKFNQKWKGT